MARAIILMADSLGIGAAPDADKFGDLGANTFAHLLKAYYDETGAALSLPNLSKLGLVDACEAAGGEPCLISDRQASQRSMGLR